MDLQQFYDEYGHQEVMALAKRAGLNWRYLYQMRVGLRKPSIDCCKRLIEASDYRLSLRGLLTRQLGKQANRYWYGISDS